MADIVLNNYSDDSRIKQYIQQNLMTRVFHDIPLNVLNTGAFSIINEYISQVTEQMAFTSTFYLNEGFITKSVLPDSIYAEAAIFNIGYGFATPSSTEILLELKLSELFKNAKLNAETGLYEFILDKDTKFNLSNGNVYSLDYDILFQYKTIDTATRSSVSAPAWNIQYINMEGNRLAVNKNRYITYRVTETWLCLFVHVSEYTRTTYTVVNSSIKGLPNEDYIIQMTQDVNICGFDVTYIDPDGNRKILSQDHILPIHDDVKDLEPYVHYIMDNQYTIRFMFQMMGNRFFVPESNSQFEITVYTCHGSAANFTEAPDEQPGVITATTAYPNNANVMKAAFCIAGSLGGTDIGTPETVRRETIEAYNTANVISTDHDIDEWFKTFYFKNILYPFFFKRRDDPWGRIWSGFLALKDDEDVVYRTNTLHGKIPYQVLYNNNDNTLSSNEIIIPPGWIWTYGTENRYTVMPYTKNGRTTVETARTLQSITARYVFANPFGIRIQKEPFAIGYFNPWISTYVAPTRLPQLANISAKDANTNDISVIYHATPSVVQITRTYKEDYYRFTTYVDVSQITTVNGQPWVRYLLQAVVPPTFDEILWNYFKRPIDLYAESIPMRVRTNEEESLVFDPEKTFLCAKKKYVLDDGTISLSGMWIQDNTDINHPLTVDIVIPNSSYLYGIASLWGKEGITEEVYVTGDTAITCYGIENDELSQFTRVGTYDYYTLHLKDELYQTIGTDQVPVTVKYVTITVSECYRSERSKHGESRLWHVGKQFHNVTLNVSYGYSYGTDQDVHTGTIDKVYEIQNAVDVYVPYMDGLSPTYADGVWTFTYPITSDSSSVQDVLLPNTILAYAEMRSTPSANAVDYYRIPFSNIAKELSIFHVKSAALPLEQNNLRILLHSYLNGTETGYVEMLPVERDANGTYTFQADMYPLNEMVDVDNLIHVATTEYGGGNWITRSGKVINIDATNPELRISILFKSTSNPSRVSDVTIGDKYTGYLMNDQYVIKDFSFVQELKEMRSVVNFDESSMPTTDQIQAYGDIIAFQNFDENGSMFDLYSVAENQVLYKNKLDPIDRANLSETASNVKTLLTGKVADLKQKENVLTLEDLQILDTGIQFIYDTIDRLIDNEYEEVFTYADDNVQTVYVKEYEAKYANTISKYSLYYHFIKEHPKSIYDNNTDETIRNRDYDLNLATDFIQEYPYSEYEKSLQKFRISTTIDGVAYRETDVVDELTYHSEIRKNINFISYVIEQMGEDEIAFTTKKDYSKLYVDQGCITELDPVEDTVYVVREDNGLDTIFTYKDGELSQDSNIIIWENVYHVLYGYQDLINEVFESTNVNGGMEVQLVPFVEYSLMNSDRFKNFVQTFTQVHKAIEPVIFKRLEGNHYLDCKLIATYGLPHSYCSDKQYFLEDAYWPDLNVQISFDVKLYNRGRASNTLSELRTIIKAYFNRLTTVHTAAQLVTMNNNIYVSHLIQQMEAHENVAYMKFNGWYTNEKNLTNGAYMNSEVQGIIQKWRRLEDMPTDELERYVPEMFVLDESNIEINVIDDNVLA